jgi:hypothetical protein
MSGGSQGGSGFAAAGRIANSARIATAAVRRGMGTQDLGAVQAIERKSFRADEFVSVVATIWTVQQRASWRNSRFRSTPRRALAIAKRFVRATADDMLAE